MKQPAPPLQSVRVGIVLGLLAAVVGCPGARPASVAQHPGTATPVADAAADAAPLAEAPPLESVEAVDLMATMGYGGHRPRRDPTDLCEPVRENLDRSVRELLGAHRPGGAVATAKPWDRKTPPKYLPLVERRFTLSTAERALLEKNGFVVPARLIQRGYADSLHDIYQAQLPIYISADAILHSVYQANDSILAEIELKLHPKLDALLERMHAALPAQTDFPPEVLRDLDIYLTVARSLLLAEDDEKGAPTAKLGTDAQVKALVAKARAGSGGLANENLFGRQRVIDFSQFAPRGHYAKVEPLGDYFRASMWLSRLEFNLVSRASRSSQPGIVPNPEETPREAVDALALANLAERAQVLGEIDTFETVWSNFAGKREDVSFRDLLALEKQAGIGRLSIPDSADKLRAAIGARFQRTMRTHYMPQGSMPLPAITTMLGPRVVADAVAETHLAHSQVLGRDMPSFADVAFMLGHDRAKTWLAKDLATFPDLATNLEKGRATLGAAGTGDLYSAWLSAIRTIAVVPEGALPSYAKTEAFADYRVNSTVAAYGQLRHNFVLTAGQAYDEGGCEVPDGYVEPALPLYEALGAYAKRGAATMQAIGMPDAYFPRLEKVLSVLDVIVKDELAGRALSEEEKRWLSMVAEIVPPSSDGPGSNDGWYFDLFPTSHEAFDEHSFVADWYTSSNANAVVYAGATPPRLGFFVVDTGGEPRVMVGPVARAFEFVGKLDTRLNDTDVAKLKTLHEPWAASYTAPAAAEPPLQVLGIGYDGKGVALRSTRALGPVTVEILDHHYTPIGKATAQVGTGWTRFMPKVSDPDSWPSAVRIRVGAWVGEARNGSLIDEAYGGMKPIEDAWELQQKLTPQP